MAEKKPSNLVVLSFEGQSAAEAVYEQFEQMEKDNLIEIEDAVVLERAADSSSIPISPYPSAGQSGSGAHTSTSSGEISVKQMRPRKGHYAAKGAGIGVLAGWLLGGPVGGLIVGAAIGGITGKMKDAGISDANVEAIKAKLHPDSSALLALGTVNDRDAFIAKVKSYDADVMLTSLTPEMEKQLRDQLAG